MQASLRITRDTITPGLARPILGVMGVEAVSDVQSFKIRKAGLSPISDRWILP